MTEKGILHFKTNKGGRRKLFSVALKLRLVDLKQVLMGLAY